MRKFTSWWRKYWHLSVGLILIVVGLLCIISFEKLTFLQKLLFGAITEIGFALMIAWVVGQTVERAAREELNFEALQNAKNIARNVFEYLYSVQLPRSLFQVVETFIFKVPVIKTKQFLEYELITPQAEAEWIKMRCYFDFTLKNISSDVVEDHPIRFHASKVSGFDEPDTPGVGMQSIIIGGRNVPAEEWGKMDDDAPDLPGQHKFVRKHTLQPGEEVRVEITFVQQKRVVDNDLWQSNCVCESFELRFKYDPEVFDAFLEPVHPAGAFDSDIPDAGDHCRRVRFNQPLLPKNGVFMWWNRKDANTCRNEL
ncbi:hypothetical protein KUV47_12090 [Vannielia litorea]|uniref:hypothetical protein n=1 Tax=Vannielia litorea TaxID=1217970 RepID=UPI001C937D04|nr:hypothetical protein [Vannielia litorea]MBY6153955.1 hypothetical protein [Vannielia litorea]